MRTVERRELPISLLVPNPKNPRTITPKARTGLKASLDRFGLVQEIVWNKRTKHVVGGHQKLDILQEEGVGMVPCAIVDLAEAEEAALMVALNNPKIQGEFDASLEELLSTIEDDLSTDLLLKELQGDVLGDPDPPIPKTIMPNVSMVWVFCGIPADQYHEASDLIEKLSVIPGAVLEQTAR